MIPDAKLQEVLKELWNRSKKDEVRWLPYDGRITPHGSRTSGSHFFLKLPNSTVSISYVSPTSDSDFYDLTIRNSDGQLVAGKTVEVDDLHAVQSGWRDILAGLFSEAFRHVTGWDKVIEELETAVKSKAPVGEVETAEVPF
jgi:hypothetical protein